LCALPIIRRQRVMEHAVGIDQLVHRRAAQMQQAGLDHLGQPAREIQLYNCTSAPMWIPSASGSNNSTMRS
jgi:hypothetical protein